MPEIHAERKSEPPTLVEAASEEDENVEGSVDPKASHAYNAKLLQAERDELDKPTGIFGRITKQVQKEQEKE